MNGTGIRLGFDKFSGLYLWVILIGIFAFWVPKLFLTMGTVHSLASSEAVVAMLAIGLCVPFAAGAFDLSVGATINLSAVLVAIFQTQEGWSMWQAIVTAIAISAAIGVINGFIVVRLGVSSFITTLGTASIILAAQEIVAGAGQPLAPTSSGWTQFSQANVFGFQVLFLYMILLALAAWWFLEYTPLGRYLYAIGDNPTAARLSGVNVGRWTWLSLIVSATVAGFAGVVFCSESGPSLTFGPALLLPGFAAIFLGSTQLRPGRVNVWGTLLAIFVLATGIKGLQYVTGAFWLNDMFDGVALVIAVSFAQWGVRRRVSASVSQVRSAAAADRELARSSPADASSPAPTSAEAGPAATSEPPPLAR